MKSLNVPSGDWLWSMNIRPAMLKCFWLAVFFVFFACGEHPLEYVDISGSREEKKAADEAKKAADEAAQKTEKEAKESAIKTAEETARASLTTFVDSRDGQVYKQVSIGSQTWMAQNLNYLAESSFCYDNNPAYCTEYGRLYTWSAAMEACPSGWHLPSRDEWETLFSVVALSGSKAVLLYTDFLNDGRCLDDAGNVFGDGSCPDSYAFSVLPACFLSYVFFYGSCSCSAFCTASEISPASADLITFGLGCAYHSHKSNAANSVRCLKN